MFVDTHKSSTHTNLVVCNFQINGCCSCSEMLNDSCVFTSICLAANRGTQCSMQVRTGGSLTTTPVIDSCHYTKISRPLYTRSSQAPSLVTEGDLGQNCKSHCGPSSTASQPFIHLSTYNLLLPTIVTPPSSLQMFNHSLLKQLHL